MGCYIIDFIFEEGELKYIPAGRDLEFNTEYDQGNYQPIIMMELSEAQEALVVWISPDGNNETHIKVLNTKASEWANRSRRHRLLIK